MVTHLFSSLLVLSLIFFLSFLNLESTFDWSIMNQEFLDLSIVLTFDKMSTMFFVVISFVFLMIYTFSFLYMKEDSFKVRFLYLLTSFYSSMGVFVFGGSLFLSMVGWDLLGVTSTLLILYFSSSSSFKAGILTFLSNRVGDCFFILSLVLFLMGENFGFHIWYFAMIFSLISLTKSAQVPFSSWLPAAMEAPTPVSSLVHSSTLVTAGIYLLLRYPSFWENHYMVKLILLVSSSMTILLASSSSLVEMDIKKVVALSTLSQMGFIMYSMVIGLPKQAFFHLLMHAFIKSLIFLLMGEIIHEAAGSQDIRYLSHSLNGKSLSSLILTFSLLTMAGLPFASGFFSKDHIIDSMQFKNFWFWDKIFLVSSFMMTSLYCGRILSLLMNSKQPLLYYNETMQYATPFLSLLTMSSIMGSYYTWLETPTFLGQSSKVSIIMVIFMCFFMSLFWEDKVVSSFLGSKWFLVPMCSSISEKFFLQTFSFSSKSSDLGFTGMLHIVFKDFLTKLSEQYSKQEGYVVNSIEIMILSILISVCMIMQ